MTSKKKELTLKQTAITNMYSIEAVGILLLEKGIMTMEEFIVAVSKIQTIHEQRMPLDPFNIY